MKKIESFEVNHLNLFPGLYVSRKDKKNDTIVTTFDLRFIAPNKEKVFSTGIMHTIEHLGATFFRNSVVSEDVIYFGPMGCRTGFYLVLFGDLKPEDIVEIVTECFMFISSYEGQIPGAMPAECGNYSDQDLKGAKVAATKYLLDLEKKRFNYL